jgi:CRISPR-associated protein (TIGR02584 family)
MPTTLIAVSGMSPAILTETVWALAHESPAIVPDDVVVITTSKGEADIQRDLLSKQEAWHGRSVWETLRAQIFDLVQIPAPQSTSKLQLSVRAIELPDPNSGVRTPAEDLRTKAHHDEAANFIIQTIAPYCDAEDQQVIASIAGGRKTMGALLYAAMSLLGKESDRVTHVLVNEPFDSVRGFFYPDQPVQRLTARLHGKEPFDVHADDARIDLADIPFVPLRNKFTELNEPRRTFVGMVESYSKAERPRMSGPPCVKLDETSGQMTVNGRPIQLTGRVLLLAAFLLRRAKKQAPHFRNKDDAKADLETFGCEWKRNHPFHQATSRISSGKLEVDDIAKALADLRKLLIKTGLAHTIPYLAPERSRIGFDIRLAESGHDGR